MMDRSASKIISCILQYLDSHNLSIPECVVDIGASDGEYSSNSLFLLKDKGWKGILFEPIYVQYDQLLTLYKNEFERVKIFNVAIAEKDEKRILYGHTNDGNGFSTDNHGASLLRGDGKRWDVECISYNTLIKIVDLDRVGILSIDTEGYDYKILKGIMENTHQRPSMIITEVISLWSKEEQDKKIALLRQNNYIPLNIGGKDDDVLIHNKFLYGDKKND